MICVCVCVCVWLLALQEMPAVCSVYEERNDCTESLSHFLCLHISLSDFDTCSARLLSPELTQTQC